jgi:hypothetical protein
MTTRNFNLRGLTPELILKMIEQGIGHTQEYIRPKFHDLDKLAGTWSEKDAEEFSLASAPFETIDEDLWK